MVFTNYHKKWHLNLKCPWRIQKVSKCVKLWDIQQLASKHLMIELGSSSQHPPVIDYYQKSNLKLLSGRTHLFKPLPLFFLSVRRVFSAWRGVKRGQEWLSCSVVTIICRYGCCWGIFTSLPSAPCGLECVNPPTLE